MRPLHLLQESIHKNSARNAFCINEIFYTYADLSKSISKIRKAIQTNTQPDEKILGLVANDDLEMYAAIFALWMEGKAYVPINPDLPKDRNQTIIQQAFVKTLIDSSEKILFPEYATIESKKLSDTTIHITPKEVSDNELVYILFTSGTTGLPKGVPITRANISAFCNAFDALPIQLNENDRCLQMFEMTFDLSVTSYLQPLLKGACIYTIPKGKIKFNYTAQLLEDHQLTYALMVPSIILNLRPYFDELHLPDLKYSMFCGEALSLEISQEWSKCVPNAQIINFYGPTEDTIYCTYYTYKGTPEEKTHNGILSIGRAMKDSITISIDESGKILPAGKTGQLCLAGPQLSPGYWNNEEKNKEAFFYADYNGVKTKFYKTGDICHFDEDGDILYAGRMDHQVKIQGFRVELSEIEFHAKTFLKKINAVATAVPDASGNHVIGLVIESKKMETGNLMEYMKLKVPAYMLPKHIEFVEEFPLNVNGKIDRNKLKQVF